MAKTEKPFRIALAGAVESTKTILESLVRNNVDVACVLGLSEKKSQNVSGYTRLDAIAKAAGIPYWDFDNINDPETVSNVRKIEPDLLFAVGLSQLVREEMLALPRHGCVGFHPTTLPQGRGRAPLAWLTLDGGEGAASFFLMDEGADSGPIFVQDFFVVDATDYASDVMDKINGAIERALDRWAPDLCQGILRHTVQDVSQATYHGKRSMADGRIDWSQSTASVYALIRAASKPHPGAYTYTRGRKLILWSATPETQLKYRGVEGSILLVDDRGALVQTGDGLIWLEDTRWADKETEGVATLRVGWKLGIDVEDELYSMRREIDALKTIVADLGDR